MSSAPTPITVTLPADIVEQLDQLAKRRRSARSKIVDAALTQYLARYASGNGASEHADIGKAGAILAARVWPEDDFSDWEGTRRAKTRSR